MKVRFHPCDYRRETKAATLDTTTHPKGGDAWNVTIDGVPVGVLRRWEREEVRTSSTPNTVRIWKTTATHWTAYRPDTTGRVFSSRDRALRDLWEYAEFQRKEDEVKAGRIQAPEVTRET
jgi:hypothetical protein